MPTRSFSDRPSKRGGHDSLLGSAMTQIGIVSFDRAPSCTDRYDDCPRNGASKRRFIDILFQIGQVLDAPLRNRSSAARNRPGPSRPSCEAASFISNSRFLESQCLVAQLFLQIVDIQLGDRIVPLHFLPGCMYNFLSRLPSSVKYNVFSCVDMILPEPPTVVSSVLVTTSYFGFSEILRQFDPRQIFFLGLGGSKLHPVIATDNAKYGRNRLPSGAFLLSRYDQSATNTPSTIS